MLMRIGDGRRVGIDGDASILLRLLKGRNGEFWILPLGFGLNGC